jgi:Ca2+-transporting ATPase
MNALVEQLQTKLEQGLTNEDAQARLLQFGTNTLLQPPQKSIWKLIAQQFEDRLVQILLAVAVVSGIFSFLELSTSTTTTVSVSSTTSTVINHESLWKSFVEPLVILAILVLNAAVGVWQTKSATASLDALQQMQPTLCTVKRQGEWIAAYPASYLVPGDVLQVRAGDKIPADARLCSSGGSTGGAGYGGASLRVDQGSLTGESVTVSKLAGDEGMTTSTTGTSNTGTSTLDSTALQDQRGMLFSGTVVTSGSGQALVVRTGMDTQFGKIQKGVTDAQQQEPKTPLALKLDDFGATLTVIIGAICLAVWLISIPKMNDPSFASVWEGAIYYAKVAVALGVAAIPEGLPAVITLCLSLGTRRMAERNVIVRKLPSVETLGCTSVICTDKTGTLTTNEMTAVSLVLLEKVQVGKKTKTTTIQEHAIDGISYSPIGQVNGVVPNEEVKSLPHGSVADVAAVAALCNDAKIIGVDVNGDGDVDVDVSDDEDMVDQHGKTVRKIHHHGQANRNNKKKDPVEKKKTYVRAGEPTEAALCVLAEKIGGMSHYLDGPPMAHMGKTGLHIYAPPSVLASANVNSWRDSHKRKATLEFNRDRKSMSVLCDYSQSPSNNSSSSSSGGNSSNRKRSRQNGNRLLVKGAPNLLLERCTHIKHRDGSVTKLTAPIRRMIEAKIKELAVRPLRCLALAVKDPGQLESSLLNFDPTDDGAVGRHALLKDSTKYKDIESGLTLVGIVGIKDPARPEVADSILECTKAGIRVMMITGDARDTAVAIARDVNIFPKETPGELLKAFEGREFFLKSDEEQLELLKTDNIVFCRAEPADKQKLVKMLQSLGEIPAMTGDGVNDAPALQQAAIGVAMGSGTEVAKEAADMILADDNFSTIVSAVEEGRRIYANMQAFICFLISCNIGEICAIFFATLAGFPEPLTAMHLLWVNLVTDGPPATALGFNPPAPDLMDLPPRPSDEPIMTRWLLTRYCLTGLYVGIATIGVFAQHYLDQGVTLSELSNWSQCGDTWSPTGGQMCSDLFGSTGRMYPQSLALTTLVCMEMLKALSAVSVDNSLLRVGPQSNPWLLLGVSGPFLLHLFVLYSAKLGLPALGESFGMVRFRHDCLEMTYPIPLSSLPF